MSGGGGQVLSLQAFDPGGRLLSVKSNDRELAEARNMRLGRNSGEMGKIINRTAITLLAVLLTVQLVALGSYVRDSRYLVQLMDRLASRALPPSDQAKKVAAFIRDKSFDTNQSFFLLPVFMFLRATPRAVAEKGGDCADRSRLLVVLLGTHGIQASKWALYATPQRPVHAVVQLESEQGKMVVDSLYGLWFPRPKGGYYSIEDLRNDPGILQKRLEELRGNPSLPGNPLVERYPLNTHIYKYARSINWDKSAGMRFLYKSLYAFVGERVDYIRRPYWAEWPALMVIYLLAGLEGCLLLAWHFALLWIRRPRQEMAVLRAQGSSLAKP
jgi:hypothetical protein